MVGRGNAVLVSENAEKRATERKGDRRRRGMAASVRRGYGRASISGKGKSKDRFSRRKGQKRKPNEIGLGGKRKVRGEICSGKG